MPTIKEMINIATPNTFSTYMNALKFGDVLRALPTQLPRKAPAAGVDYNVAALYVVQLPMDAKAARILRAQIITGTGGVGEVTPIAYGATPSTTECAVTPNGDIAFAAADVPLTVDIIYQPLKYDLITLTLPAPAGVLTIPTAIANRGVLQLLAATATKGTNLGKKIILVPSTTPATTKANLNAAKTQVLFNFATDAVTEGTVTLAVSPAVDIDAVLEATATV
jgi:hypothetical protein